MPAPIRDLILAPEKVRFQVAAEPVHNALHSMLLLLRVDEFSGLDGWIIKTAEALPKEVVERHRLILLGVHYAVVPKRSFNTFEDYLEDLRSRDPLELREQLLEVYTSIEPHDDTSGELRDLSEDEILEDVDTFLAFLHSRFEPELIYEDVERGAFELLQDPEKLRVEIVTHLTMMWEKYFKAEFKRREPMIDQTVTAFNEFDFEAMEDEEVVRFVTGQWNEKLQALTSKHEHIIFVPSPHTGPYTGPLFGGDTLRLMFSCRLPQGSPMGLSEVSRAEMLVWLSALADDSRLHILALLKEHGELCAQEIITILETSQSTTSRHLRQLSASGYIREHRTEAGKCYRLNEERFEDTVRALQTFIS